MAGLSEETRDRIALLYESGESKTQIARETETSKPTVYKVLREYNLIAVPAGDPASPASGPEAGAEAGTEAYTEGYAAKSAGSGGEAVNEPPEELDPEEEDSEEPEELEELEAAAPDPVALAGVVGVAAVAAFFYFTPSGGGITARLEHVRRSLGAVSNGRFSLRGRPPEGW